MSSNAEDQLNSIEIRHRDAILKAGLTPDDFVFEAQLSRWQERGYWVQGDELDFIRQLARWSPSRYELIELLPLYYLADGHIRTMQRMSADRFPYEAADFSIATEPRQLATARAESQLLEKPVDPRCSTFMTQGSGSETVPSGGEPESIVWMHVGLVNVLKSLANHFTRTLVPRAGGLVQFVQSLSSGADPFKLFSHLAAFNGDATEGAEPTADHDRRAATPDAEFADISQDYAWALPPIEPFPSSEPVLQGAAAWLLIASVTFIAGHEAGHIFVGHTGVRDVVQPLLGTSAQLSDRQGREIAADIVGMSSVWDGMSQAEIPGPASIDYTWLGPVLFLAARAGMAAATVDPDDAESVEDLGDWLLRFQLLVKNLIVSLKGNGFESDRIEAILVAAPLVGGAVYEWMRLGGILASRRAGEFDADAYLTLKRGCDKLRLRLGI